MKTNFRKQVSILLSFILVLSFSQVMGAESFNFKKKKKVKTQQVIDTLKYNVYKGVIKDKATGDLLIFANISVNGSNVATVSNSDGEFLLKIAKNRDAKTITVSHIGFKNTDFAIVNLKRKKNILELESAIVPLGEINIYPHDPLFLVRSILRKVAENYTLDPNMMKGFYRETIKKNRSYVALSEAVVNINKSGYRQIRDDQVQIFKGRKSQHVKKMDTLLFKLQGGPKTTLLLDIIKNPYNLLSGDFIENYDYTFKNITKLNDKVHYVIEFRQKEGIELPLYYGLFYIDANNLALSSAKFSLNMANESEVRRMFIRKKPSGVKVTPLSADYIVNYQEKGGKWYFTYARGEIKFKCNWKRKLFNSKFSVMTELAITDRSDTETTRFKARERFKSNQVMADQIGSFGDKNFWGASNTIEPDQSIEAAIRKLKRKGK